MNMSDMEYRNGTLCLDKFNISGVENYSIENPEWLNVLIDKDGKIIKGTYIDGKEYITTNNKNKKWFGKTWACLGDSMTEANRKTTKHYFDFIQEETGIYPFNFGVGGTGYARHQNVGKAFYQRAAQIPECDLVTIFGSFNDIASNVSIGEPTDSGTTTICGCINETINVLQTNHPLIPIGIASSIPWAGAEPNDSSVYWYEEYVQKLGDVCKLRGIPFLDLYHTSNMHPSNPTFRSLAFDEEGVHMNAIGHKILYPKIKTFLESIIS